MESDTTTRLIVSNTSVDLKRAGQVSDRLTDTADSGKLSVTTVPITGPRKAGPRPRRRAEHRQMWETLAAGDAECALVELSDLEVWPDDEITLACCLPRTNAREGLIHKEGTRFKDLEPSSRLAAESELSRRQLSELNPDIEWVDLAGDLPTQLHKIHLGQADGLIAPAGHFGLLGFGQQAYEFLSMETILPRPGQGVWGVFCASARQDQIDLFTELDDGKTRLCAMSELELAIACDLPNDSVGAWARMQRGKLLIDGACTAPDGLHRTTVTGKPSEREKLVNEVASLLHSK